MSEKVLLKVTDLKKEYKIHRFFEKSLTVKALRGISLELIEGETLAVVGESGCGKSTLAKVLMKIEAPTSGVAICDGKSIEDYSSKQLPTHMQMIFQDPYSSLNPRRKIEEIIAEPLVIKGGQTREEVMKKVADTAAMVGLRPELLKRYPHMLSGGQRQRVGIARALVTEPKVLICDEPVSALDVSVQAQVLNLLLDLQQQKKLSFLFISHDLGVVRFLAHRVAVMYLGVIVETGTAQDVFERPAHPYTQLLLASTPHVFNGSALKTDLVKAVDNSELPSPLKPPAGCGFHTRCPYMTDICKNQIPELRSYKNQDYENQKVACHHAEKICGQ
jgi:dipeptide transport system ATP-binding protein